MCIGIHMGGRWPGRAPMGLGVYSIQRSVMKRGCGAIPGFRSSCVMLHYGCCENQLEPSNLASSAMKNRIGYAMAIKPTQHYARVPAPSPFLASPVGSELLVIRSIV